MPCRYERHSEGVRRLVGDSRNRYFDRLVRRKWSQITAQWPVPYGGLQEACRDEGAVEVNSLVALQVVQELRGRQTHHVVCTYNFTYI
jgi:hypothetical protein